MSGCYPPRPDSPSSPPPFAHPRRVCCLFLANGSLCACQSGSEKKKKKKGGVKGEGLVGKKSEGGEEVWPGTPCCPYNWASRTSLPSPPYASTFQEEKAAPQKYRGLVSKRTASKESSAAFLDASSLSSMWENLARFCSTFKTLALTLRKKSPTFVKSLFNSSWRCLNTGSALVSTLCRRPFQPSNLAWSVMSSPSNASRTA